MLKFNTILFPVDFSERCRGAAHYVQAFAGRFGSKLILLHVMETAMGQPGDMDFAGLAGSVQWEDRTARTRDLLHRFLADELAFFPIERKLEMGDPARTIVRVASESNVDLIMMPTHGYGPFRRFLLGSVTAKVLHDATCAVWTGVHLEDAPPLEAIGIRTIVCALDLTSGGQPALSAAAELADEYGAELILAHAAPGSEVASDRSAEFEAQEHLLSQAREQLLAMAKQAGVDPAIIVHRGEVGSVISRVAREHTANLVVIGRGHHRARLRTHSYAIISQSPCPVLSV